MAAILLVVDDKTNLTAGDTAVQTMLENAGHTVTLISDDDAEADAGSYACAVFPVSANEVTLGSKYLNWTSGLAILDPAIAKAYNLVDSGVSVSSGSATQIGIENDAHDLANGLAAGNHTIFSTSQTMAGYTTPQYNASADIVGNRAGGAAKVLVGYETGDALENSGGNAPARRVFFGLSGGAVQATNATGDALFVRAVEWAGELLGTSETVTATLVDSFNEDDAISYTIDTGDANSDFNDPFTDTLSRTYFIGTRGLEDISPFGERLVVLVNDAPPVGGTTGADTFDAGRDRKLRRVLAGVGR